MKKKILSLLVAFIAAGALSGCGKPPSSGGTKVIEKCGNGDVDAGEKCDKKIAAGETGACPTAETCQDDGKELSGEADKCTAECVAPKCGNGDVDAGETCDTKGKGDQKCVQRPACEAKAATDGNHKWVYSGKYTECTAKCEEVAYDCNSAEKDGFCPEKCTPDNDADCVYGKSCTRDGDCSSLGAGFKCLAVEGTGSGPSFVITKGYCVSGLVSKSSSDPEVPNPCGVTCPAGGECSKFYQSSDGDYLAFCSPSCSKDSDCFEGSFCATTDGVSTCMPKVCDPADPTSCIKGTKCNPATYQCSPYSEGTKTAGEYCTSSSDCEGGFKAICVDFNGKGGYCSQTASKMNKNMEGFTCPPSFLKVGPKSEAFSLCVVECSANGAICANGPVIKSDGFSCKSSRGLELCLHDDLPVVNIPKDKVGLTCTDADKATACGSSDALCLTSADSPVFADNGYCSIECEKFKNECPDGSSCVYLDAARTKQRCIKTCVADTDCAGSNKCLFLSPTATSGYCLKPQTP